MLPHPICYVCVCVCVCLLCVYMHNRRSASLVFVDVSLCFFLCVCFVFAKKNKACVQPSVFLCTHMHTLFVYVCMYVCLNVYFICVVVVRFHKIFKNHESLFAVGL